MDAHHYACVCACVYIDVYVCVRVHVNNQLNYRQTHLGRRRPNLGTSDVQIAAATRSYTRLSLIICREQKTQSKHAYTSLPSISPPFNSPSLSVCFSPSLARTVNGISVTSGSQVCALINAVSIAMLHVLIRQETAVTAASRCVYNPSKCDKSRGPARNYYSRTAGEARAKCF